MYGLIIDQNKEGVMEVKNERFELRVDSELLGKMDKWRAALTDIPSRSEAARRLIEAGLGSQSNHQLFQLMKFQILLAAKSGVGISDAYAYAWDNGVYPFFDEGATFHEPFSSHFDVTPEMVDDLTKYLDDCWMEKKVPTFYEIEDHYKVMIGRTKWDRSKLISTCRYLFLKDSFDGQFWKTLLTPMEHPTEASSVTRKFSAENDIYFT